MTKREPLPNDTLEENLAALEKIWRRSPFHDMGVESIIPLNRRVIIMLDDWALVFVGVSRFVHNVKEYPTVWLDAKASQHAGQAELRVVCETGEFSLVFGNLRLIRRSDMAIIVPPIDR